MVLTKTRDWLNFTVRKVVNSIKTAALKELSYVVKVVSTTFEEFKEIKAVKAVQLVT